MIGLIILNIINISYLYKLLYGLFCLLIYSKLKKSFINFIKKRERLFTNYYQTLILEINLLYMIIKKQDDRYFVVMENIRTKSIYRNKLWFGA